MAVMLLGELTVKLAAGTPLKVTPETARKLLPAIAICVPGAPLPGVRVTICGLTESVALWATPTGW